MVIWIKSLYRNNWRPRTDEEENTRKLSASTQRRRTRYNKQGQSRSVQYTEEELIHFLRPSHHSNELLNIASGKTDRDSSVNVTDWVEIEKEQMKEFHAKIPDGFNSPIKKKVKLIKAEKTCTIGDIVIYSTEAIYTRIICFMSTSSIEIEHVLKYELPPVPTSLFDENGDMQLNKREPELKNTLKTEVSNRHII